MRPSTGPCESAFLTHPPAPRQFWFEYNTEVSETLIYCHLGQPAGKSASSKPNASAGHWADSEYTKSVTGFTWKGLPFGGSEQRNEMESHVVDVKPRGRGTIWWRLFKNRTSISRKVEGLGNWVSAGNANSCQWKKQNPLNTYSSIWLSHWSSVLPSTAQILNKFMLNDWMPKRLYYRQVSAIVKAYIHTVGKQKQKASWRRWDLSDPWRRCRTLRGVAFAGRGNNVCKGMDPRETLSCLGIPRSSGWQACHSGTEVCRREQGQWLRNHDPARWFQGLRWKGRLEARCEVLHERHGALRIGKAQQWRRVEGMDRMNFSAGWWRTNIWSGIMGDSVPPLLKIWQGKKSVFTKDEESEDNIAERDWRCREIEFWRTG